GHARGLQRGGAEAVDGRPRHVVVDARQQQREAPDVVALLALAVAAAHHHVADRGLLELRVALDQRAQRYRRQIVGAHGLQRALGGAPDRGADGVDDYCFGHLGNLLDRSAYVIVTPQRDQVATQVVAQGNYLGLEAATQLEHQLLVRRGRRYVGGAAQQGRRAPAAQASGGERDDRARHPPGGGRIAGGTAQRAPQPVRLQRTHGLQRFGLDDLDRERVIELQKAQHRVHGGFVVAAKVLVDG